MNKRRFIIYYLLYFISVISPYAFFIMTRLSGESLYMIVVFTVIGMVVCPIISIISGIALFYITKGKAECYICTLISVLFFFVATSICLFLAGGTNRYNPVSSAITLAAMNALEMLIIHVLYFFAMKLYGRIRTKNNQPQ